MSKLVSSQRGDIIYRRLANSQILHGIDTMYRL